MRLVTAPDTWRDGDAPEVVGVERLVKFMPVTPARDDLEVFGSKLEPHLSAICHADELMPLASPAGEVDSRLHLSNRHVQAAE